MRRAFPLLASLLLMGGCELRNYCVDCFGADAGHAEDGAVPDGAVLPADAAPDACVPTGPEVCDGVDNDCNGEVDDGVLPQVGDPCGSTVGTCTEGVLECQDGRLVCGGGAILPRAEECNGLDDDCNGEIDDGDPEGGVACGSSVGECVPGLSHCVDGQVVCVGAVDPMAETCDGKDNDCDGEIDNGNPEGGAACGGDQGECAPGMVTCVGGTLRCAGASGPRAETCNGLDDDCDGLVDEDFNLAIDARNCGGCGLACGAAHGSGACEAGECKVGGCDADWWDRDGDYDNGCEYHCVYQGAEICNGEDDNCDGNVDEELDPPDVCARLGECAGTVAQCAGVTGWKCVYPPAVSQNGAGEIVPETDCDGRDNDCNGLVDDAFPQRDRECTRGVGACQTTGHLVCNGSHDGLVCDAADPGPPQPESCNGIDDDCNGLVDDGAPDDWVTITGAFGTRQIYAYEASRPDATSAAQGSMSHRSCSTAGRLPWTNVTHPEAAAACAAAGGRLCTEAEWQRACETAASTPCPWSYGASCQSYQATACNGNDLDFDPALPGDQDGLLPAGALAACYADWGSAASRVFDLSGNAKEWTQARAPGINPLRGGAYNNTRVGISCGYDFVVADDTFLFRNVGFRCCRD